MRRVNVVVNLGKAFSLLLIIILAGSVVTVAFSRAIAPVGQASAQEGGQGQQPLHISIKYTQFLDQSGCLGQWCGTNIFTGSFASAANLHPFEDGYAGNGTGLYEQTEDRDTDPVPPACPQRGSYHRLISGPAVLEVIASPSGLNYTVQVTWTGEYQNTWEKTECGQYESGATVDAESSTTCDFYEVDLEKGGTYEIAGPIEGGVCSMTITPQICELVTTNYASYHRTEPITSTFSFKNNALRHTSGALEGNDRKSFEYVSADQGASKGCLKIKVVVEPSEIHLKYRVDQKDVEKKPEAKVTVTVTKGDSPLKNKAVVIKVCTLPGTATTDGHIWHDERASGWEKTWDKPCDQKERPFAELLAKDGNKGKLLVQRTDSNGKIELKYTPPKYKQYQYIAGTDKITATLQEKPLIQGIATVITKVPDLRAMPGSGPSPACPSQRVSVNYTFAAQGGSKHGCLFYGTAATNAALERIANEFVQRQKDCMNACLVGYSGTPYLITIKGPPVPVQINAMSLPWGGLTDNVLGVKWSPPHETHNDGRQVDLSFAIFLKKATAKENALCSTFGKKCANYDIDRILLLRDVIVNSPNFYKFPGNEGDNLLSTFNHKSPHIHIYFKN